MKPASADRIPFAAATVMGGDGRTRAAITKTLEAGRFEIHPAPGPRILTVLIAATSEVDRLREIRTLADAQPESSILLVIPPDVPNASLRRSLVAGVAGIVLASELDHALAPTARAILAGQLAVPSTLARQIAPRPLSHREKQILRLVVEGLTNREIATRLFLAESTIKTHLSSAFRKIDARSRSEAVARIQDPDTGYGMGILTSVDGPAASVA